MLSLRSIVLLVLVSSVGNGGLVAQAPKDEALVEQVARLPWTTDEVNIHDSVQDDSKIVLVAHYTNPDVVADTDTAYISMHPFHWHWSVDKSDEMHGCCRGGQNGWCNGAGDFSKVTKDGFDYGLSLTWQFDGQHEKTFNQVFHCLWVKEQTFKKDGFTVTVKASMK